MRSYTIFRKSNSMKRNATQVCFGDIDDWDGVSGDGSD